MGITSIDIGGRVFVVKLLASTYERWSLVGLTQTDAPNAAAVALGRCLPELGLTYRGSPQDFGPKAGDALLERGCNYAEILMAGIELITAMQESLVPTAEEVDQTRGNSLPLTVKQTA
jgi:hypothetical protein